MKGKLYIVATPIGNLGDMTGRAVEILQKCDIIAAEDTLNSMNLLNKFNIRAKLMSNHKFNEQASCDFLLCELLSGKDIAVISDAGTPCISDPGTFLVRRAAENDITIEAVPGACAAAAAVSISGFEAKSFVFAGFFPRENGGIKKIIKKLQNNPGIYIFYESPKRIIKTFEVFAEYLTDTQVCLCNDLTKKFERVYRGTPDKILRELNQNTAAEKGEYTVVLAVPDMPDKSEASAFSVFSIEAVLTDIMIKQNCTLKTAVRTAAAEYNLNKNEVYAASLNLKKFIRG